MVDTLRLLQDHVCEGGGDVEPEHGRHGVLQLGHVAAVDAVHGEVVRHGAARLRTD